MHLKTGANTPASSIHQQAVGEDPADPQKRASPKNAKNCQKMANLCERSGVIFRENSSESMIGY
jgi:hypothetical protein